MARRSRTARHPPADPQSQRAQGHGGGPRGVQEDHPGTAQRWKTPDLPVPRGDPPQHPECKTPTHFRVMGGFLQGPLHQAGTRRMDQCQVELRTSQGGRLQGGSFRPPPATPTAAATPPPSTTASIHSPSPVASSDPGANPARRHCSARQQAFECPGSPLNGGFPSAQRTKE